MTSLLFSRAIGDGALIKKQGGDFGVGELRFFEVKDDATSPASGQCDAKDGSWWHGMKFVLPAGNGGSVGKPRTSPYTYVESADYGVLP